jgi:hypothetical protein
MESSCPESGRQIDKEQDGKRNGGLCLQHPTYLPEAQAMEVRRGTAVA